MTTRKAVVQPWRPREQAALLTGLVVSALVVLAGWVGVSQQARLTDQYRWFTLAAVGVVGSGIVQARWLLAGFVEVRRREREVLHDLLPGTPSVSNDDEPAQGFVIVDGSRSRYHMVNCSMVAGKQTHRWTGSDGDGREPCGLCQRRPPRAG